MALVTADLIDVTAYRVAAPAYYERALSAFGARQFSGRFNPVGLSVLYFALDYETAVAEYYGSGTPRPCVLIPVHLSVKNLIDLRGSPKRWPRDWQDWDCDWKLARDARAKDPFADCASWRCGQNVITRNCSGVIFPSTKRMGGVNVALFPEDAIVGNCEYKAIDKLGEIAALHAPQKSGGPNTKLMKPKKP